MMAFKAVDEFLLRQNWPPDEAKNWNIAVKFLMARRFDVDRAVELYSAHESLRRKENLHLIHLNDKNFIADLDSGKFTILPFIRDQPVCALFTVRLHCQNPANELITLQSLIYQLDAALENPDAQRSGIIFIYDMNNCKRSNYDLGLSQKILTLIRGSYPARLHKLYVLSAPFWFKCLVKVLSVLMREKLRERVVFVKNEEIKNYVSTDILPDYLGGCVKLDHKAWLSECSRLVSNKASTCFCYYTADNEFYLRESQSQAPHKLLAEADLAASRKRPSSGFIDIEDNKQKVFMPNKSPVKANAFGKKSHNYAFNGANGSNNGHNGFYDNNFQYDDAKIKIGSIHQDTDEGMSVEELVNYVQDLGVGGMLDEYKFLRALPYACNYDAFNDPFNQHRNRYKDVICFDDTRVKLQVEEGDIGDDETNMCHSDYIHANYVDGYKQKNAYISTQGPLDDTCEDFWRMVWQQQTLVIVMTTKVREQRRVKCAQYWPLELNDKLTLSVFEIAATHVDAHDNFVITTLELQHLKLGEKRTLAHCQFVSWPDHGVPKSAGEMLDFLRIVRDRQSSLLTDLGSNWFGHPMGPPIIVHCSAGIGRTGTFCTIDISINRLLDNQTVNIKDVVKKIRTQRALSVQMPDQYVFCYLAILEFAMQKKLLLPENSAEVLKLFAVNA